MKLLESLVLGLIHLYRWTISPLKTLLLGPAGGCRFHPSCSAYGIEAVHRHGPVHGSCLTARRIARCHPWGGHGHDPVPEK